MYAWVWVHNLSNRLLRKGGMWGKSDLEAGRTKKNSFGQYSSLSKQLESRTSGDKQLFV
jgi:hypothetical protein